MNPALILFGIVVFAAVLFAIHLRRDSQSIARELLETWAGKCGLKILSAGRQGIISGPFPLPLNGQFVLRFRAVDSQGKTISGWARCGSPGTFFLSEKKIEVQLD